MKFSARLDIAFDVGGQNTKIGVRDRAKEGSLGFVRKRGSQ